MGDLIRFRRHRRKWTRAADYGKVLPTKRWSGEPPPRGPGWIGTLRPWVLLVTLITLWVGLDVETLEPLPGLASDPERVAGNFTRCGPGRGTYCVIDGDTFKLGERNVRVLGIDAPELHPPRCTAEAQQGEAATVALQTLLNQGPFAMIGRINDMEDRYGRDLRSISRQRPDGTTQLISQDLLAEGTVRRYLGGARSGWC